MVLLIIATAIIINSSATERKRIANCLNPKFTFSTLDLS